MNAGDELGGLDRAGLGLGSASLELGELQQQAREAVVEAALPGRRWRAVEAQHPYTIEGRQIDVADGDVEAVPVEGFAAWHLRVRSGQQREPGE